jgi:hypothetical protein
MTEIDNTGSFLVAELEQRVDQDSLDIASHARERDRKLGEPNIVSNILVPLWSLIKDKPLEDGDTNK